MSSTERNEMIKSLKEFVFPDFRKSGFTGSFPHFRRATNERLNLLTFQFDRYGGAFVIEIANCTLNGFVTHWGKIIPPKKITAHDLAKRMRIQSNMNTPDSSPDHWFRYDSPSLQLNQNIYKEICLDVLSKMPIAEQYWKYGELN
jgi:hypothetical protein